MAEVFVDFPQSLYTNSGIVPSNETRPPLSKSLSPTFMVIFPSDSNFSTKTALLNGLDFRLHVEVLS